MQKSLEVKELLGVDRNRVQGQADGVLAPTRLFNLVPDRTGGYTPFGRRVDKGVTLPHLDKLVAFDEGGLATVRDSLTNNGKLILSHGAIVFTQDMPNYTDLDMAAHLALAGSYISRDQFLVLNRDEVKVQPVKLEIEAKPVSSPASTTQTIGSSAIRDIDYGGSTPALKRWMLVNDDGEVYESLDGRDWELKFTATKKLSGVTYGNGRWVAVGGDAAGPVAHWALETDTATWSAGATPLAEQHFSKVTYDVDSVFIASGNEIFRTVDGGVNWTQVDDTHDGLSNTRTNRVSIYHPAGTPSSDSVYYAPGDSAGMNGVQFVSSDGITWSGGQSGGANDHRWDSAVSPTGLFVFVTNTGEVWSAAAPDAKVGVFTKHTDNLMGQAEDISAVRYNPTTDTWFVAGNGGQVMESTTLYSWTPVQFDAETTSDLFAMGVADDGEVIVGGDGGVVLTAYGSSGLATGTYDVITIAYFNTRAGKFVFNVQSQEVGFPERGDNAIEVKASTKDRVSADTFGDPAYGYTPPAELLNDIRVDVFLRYDPNNLGNVDEQEETYEEIVNEPITVYDFTASLESGAASGDDSLTLLGEAIEETPLGSELGGGKGVTTSVFENPQTALHAGRLWGMASQDEDKYPDDDVPKEIANVHGDFVLCYSEPGWVNLIRPDNYLPLRPTQSTVFTGILSTPGGLMVFFDNEAFVVDGDPSVGTLGYTLYPDIIGNDIGSTPCKLGGVPFSVWKGQVYALVGGRVEPVSGPVYRRDDPFVKIAPEPQERSLLALTESGKVYRYDFTRQFWSDNVVSDDVVEMLPNCNCGTGDNTLYANALSALFVARRDGTPDTPAITYRGIDFGNPRTRKAIYRVSVPVEQMYLAATIIGSDTREGDPGSEPYTLRAPPQAGDVLICFNRIYSTASYSVTPPAGWTTIGAFSYYRVCDGTEGSEFVFEWSGGSGVGALYQVRGADGITPVAHAVNSDGTGGVSTTSITIGPLTPADGNLMLLAWGHSGSFSVDKEWAIPESIAEIVDLTYGKGSLVVGYSNSVPVGVETSWTATSSSSGVTPRTATFVSLNNQVVKPRLYYSRESEPDVESGGQNFVDARDLEEILDWRLPLGRKSRLVDLSIELRGMGYQGAIFPGLELVYSEAGSVR